MMTGISAAASYVCISALAWLVMYLEKKSWPGAWKAVLTYPIFLLSWAVINVLGHFLPQSHMAEHSHTESLGIDDMKRLYKARVSVKQ